MKKKFKGSKKTEFFIKVKVKKRRKDILRNCENFHVFSLSLSFLVAHQVHYRSLKLKTKSINFHTSFQMASENFLLLV